MRSKLVISSLALIASALALGCGGDEDLAGASKPAADGGMDASTSDGAQTDGPGSDAADDVVDDASSDVVSDDPGVEAAPDVVLPACAPPTDPNAAALCLVLEPEVLDLIAEDEKLDGQGIFLVQVYDTPEPELPDGSEVTPLAEFTIPDQPGGPTPVTMGVYDVVDPIRFDGLPATVYVRALFFDNFDAFATDGVAPGIWMGGWDFSQGLFFDELLQPVALSVGAGTEVSMPMTALRSMQVTLTKSFFAQPRGNGEGPAGYILFDTQDLATAPNGWGSGVVPCASIHVPSGIVVEGAFIGAGPFFGFGFLDDFGKGIENDIPPGTMVNLSLFGGQLSLPADSEIVVPPSAYRVETALELTGTVPFQGLPPADPMSCP